MEQCRECLTKGGGCGEDKLTWRQFVFSFLAAVVGVVFLVVILNNIQARAANKVPVCMTREEVAGAAALVNKCLTIFGDGVYDFTLAKKWDLTGHVGKHLCGKEYDKETIEKGPHKIGVIDKFYYTKVCGTAGSAAGSAATKTATGWPKTVLGMSWLKLSSYLALLFFVLNFATCYAMPWAGVKEPWKGNRPGRDKDDFLGAFPLTHMHKVWAWLAIFSLSFHGLLGFAGVLLGKWY